MNTNIHRIILVKKVKRMFFFDYYAEQVDDKSELFDKFEELDGVLNMSILKQDASTVKGQAF